MLFGCGQRSDFQRPRGSRRAAGVLGCPRGCGTVRITDTSVFPASKTISAALVEVEPGGMRELHWHPNTDKWQYHIEGQASEKSVMGYLLREPHRPTW
jgi:hypothetical protein